MEIRAELTAPGVEAGSGEADFTRLYERDYPNIMRYLLRRGAQEAAADLAAETFVIAWQRRDQWRGLPEERQTAWVYGVARRVSANAVRSGRRAAGFAERFAHGAHSGHADHGGPGMFAVRQADHSDQVVEQIAVGRAFARLSEADRELIRLVAWDGLTPAQVAEVLGCRIGTVNTRLHRARRRLRALIGTEPAEAARITPLEGRTS
ncbi:RNA polymerase sigma factor [Catenulispora subtropica]|uniref:RNA polymerase sigma factor n=1 Tax=Catenulispora subtropica TaxID=450798 RepID=A0ABN2SA49_9ACTN